MTQLRSGLAALGLKIARPELLLDYVACMIKWNRAYNLTSVRKPEAMLVRHIFDSLAIANYLEGKRIVDVGSGAGLPGIPLAIAFPDRQFTLVESNGKKVSFLFQVKLELGLTNVEVAHSRIEEFRPPQCFDMAISRAFASLLKMVEQTEHVLCAHGKIAAMKGFYPVAELAELVMDVDIYELKVPGLEEQRHLVICAPKNAASKQAHNEKEVLI